MVERLSLILTGTGVVLLALEEFLDSRGTSLDKERRELLERERERRRKFSGGGEGVRSLVGEFLGHRSSLFRSGSGSS